MYCYKTHLLEEIERRRKKNSAYSLRAFAKHSKVNPTTLSLVLNGKRTLSTESVEKLCSALRLGPLESKIFHASVLSSSARSESVRKKYQKSLENLLQKKSLKYENDLEISNASFKFISDWFYTATLECLKLKSYQKVEPEKVPLWLSKKLKVSKSQIQLALNSLESLRLIEVKNEKPWPTQGLLRSGDKTTSRAIQSHHLSYLNKAIESIETQTLDERDFSGIVVAIDEKRIPEAKKMIQDFRHKLNQFLRGDEPTRVYRLGINFFAISEKEIKK